MVITHYLSDEGASALEGLRRYGFEVAVALVGAGQLVDFPLSRGGDRPADGDDPYGATPWIIEFWQPGRS